MAKDNNINIIIKLKNLASNELKKVRDGFSNAGNSAKGFRGAVSNLASFLASKFVITLGDVQRAIGGVINFFKKTSQASQEQEDAVNKLNTALKNQGIFTREVTKELQNQARVLQKNTKFGDEQILQLQAQLINFGVLPKEINRVTQATLDLAEAQGMDINTAGNLLAKSLGSSTNALARYGIEITGAVGSTERLDTAVKNISERFGGQAQSAAETARGTYAQLGNQIGDLREKFGDMINKAFLPFANILKTVVERINTAIDSTRVLREEEELFANALSKLGAEQQKNSKETEKQSKRREEAEKKAIEQQKMRLITAGNFTREQLKNLSDDELKIIAERAKAINDDMKNNSREARRERSSLYQSMLDMAINNGQQILDINSFNAEIQRRENLKLADERKKQKEKELEEEKIQAEKRLEIEKQLQQAKAQASKDAYEAINNKITELNAKQVKDAQDTSDLLASITDDGGKTIGEHIKKELASKIDAWMASEIAKAQLSAPMTFGASLASIAPIIAAGTAGKAAINAVKFADGGVVKAQQGGVTGSINGLPSTVAENRSDEAIIPLEDDARVKELMGGGQTVVNLIVDGQRLAQAVVNGYNKGRAINTVTKIKEN